MTIHLQSLLIAIPFTIVTVLFVWRVKKEDDPGFWAFIALAILLIVICLGIPYAWKLNFWFGAIYLAICIVPSSAMAIEVAMWDSERDWSIGMIIIGAGLALIIFIVSIPIAVIPTLKHTETQIEEVKIDPEALEESVSRISTELQNFETALL